MVTDGMERTFSNLSALCQAIELHDPADTSEDSPRVDTLQRDSPMECQIPSPQLEEAGLQGLLAILQDQNSDEYSNDGLSSSSPPYGTLQLQSKPRGLNSSTLMSSNTENSFSRNKLNGRQKVHLHPVVHSSTLQITCLHPSMKEAVDDHIQRALGKGYFRDSAMSLSPQCYSVQLPTSSPKASSLWAPSKMESIHSSHAHPHRRVGMVATSSHTNFPSGSTKSSPYVGKSLLPPLAPSSSITSSKSSITAASVSISSPQTQSNSSPLFSPLLLQRNRRGLPLFSSPHQYQYYHQNTTSNTTAVSNTSAMRMMMEPSVNGASNPSNANFLQLPRILPSLSE